MSFLKDKSPIINRNPLIIGGVIVVVAIIGYFVKLK